MHRFPVVLSVGLVALATVLPVLSECEYSNVISAINNFNANAFFNGTWYLTHVYVPSKTINGRGCGSIKSSINGSRVRQFITAITETYPKNTVYHWLGFSTLRNITVGKHVLKLKRANKDETPIVLYPIKCTETIIDTDYENYALIYRCFSQGVMYVFSRSPNVHNTHPNVEIALNRIGLKLNNFVRITNLNCTKY